MCEESKKNKKQQHFYEYIFYLIFSILNVTVTLHLMI